MINQDINREIAEALTEQGLDKFAWGKRTHCRCKADKVTYLDGEECTFCGHIAVWKPADFTLQRLLDPADGVMAVIYASPDRDWVGLAPHGHSIEALREAFHAALTGGAE